MTEVIAKLFGRSSLRNRYLSSAFLSATICLFTQVMAQAQTAGPFSAKPAKIEGHGRALEEVLTQVQLAFKYPIYYEELPFEDSSDVKHVASPGKKTVLVSPVSDLTVTLSEIDSTPYLAIESVLSAYTQAGYPGVYKVTPREHRIDVLPAQIRSSSGSMKNVRPLLTMPITFPLAQRNVADTLQLIGDIVSKQSGYRVEAIGVPGFLFQTVELGANQESLGDVFEKLINALGGNVSVSFRYMIDEKTYYFDFVGVAPPSPPGEPIVPGQKLIAPKHGPANSPFFIKTQ